jgi:two-component system OmpR family response regulator
MLYCRRENILLPRDGGRALSCGAPADIAEPVPAERSFMQPTTHILIVDDDREIRDLLSRILTRRGFKVSAAREEQEMRRVLASSRIDLVVLDLMLPGKDGLALCRELRTTMAIPIIMLTARGEPTDRVVGLEMGADDYLAKPFDPRELEARIRAVLRRSSNAMAAASDAQGAILKFGGWTLDLRQRQLTSPDGDLVDVTSGEFDLLAVFAERPQRILRRDQLIDLARGRDAAPFDRSIDVQVSRLRRKLEVDPRSPQIIKTIRSGGYIFTPAVDRS